MTSRDLFLVVLTPESWASDWVCEELALALAAKKRIIGVLQQQTQVTGFLVQRQMISVLGQSAATAAQTVAASLEVQAKAQADLRTEQPQAPFPPSATLQTPSLKGEWTEAVGLEARWMFAITQNGQILTGTWAVDSPPASGHIDARPITGHVSEEEITIEFDLSGGAHYILRLRLVEGKLVGTKWTSIYGGQTGLGITLERR